MSAQKFSKDFRLYEPGKPALPVGHEGALVMLTKIRDKLPGVQVEALDMVEEGDRVAVRWLFSATEQGDNRQMACVAVYRFTNGLISEDWGLATLAGW